MRSISSSASSPAPSTEDSLLAELSSGTTAPSSSAEQAIEPATVVAKKKKKKKGKKASAKPTSTPETSAPAEDAYSIAPCFLSRNKHMRYISSYQGSWLQLPVEILDSLLTLNLEPLPLHSPEQYMSSSSRKTFISGLNGKQRAFERTATPSSDHTPPDSPPLFSVTTPLLDAFSEDLPPPIDPGVFRSVINIRRLVEEATSLTVRANSGLSAAALGSMQITPNASPWALAQSLGINPLGDMNYGNGRKAAMSATRIHRLRVLAVQKLAAAYRHDEIAASVMTMQSGSVFDDLADRVLKVDPHHSDALYVNHFHEKIPSRQVGEYTTTDNLDGLIAAHPHCLEYYRSRGIIYTFREEYTSATRDFTHVLNQARSLRKARAAHVAGPAAGKGSKKNKSSNSLQRQTEAPSPRSTTSEDAPEPIELQALFLRSSTYIQYAASVIEDKALALEGVPKTFYPNGQELRLAEPLPGARYGGVETGHPDGPLGARDGVKVSAYRDLLAGAQLRQQVFTLARKSIRDAEKFLTHFAALDPPGPGSGLCPLDEIPGRIAYSYALAAALRPGVRTNLPNPPADLPRPAIPPPYHPLLCEAHFILLLGHLLLGDFTAVLHGLIRAARVIEVLEGGPIFLPPRSLAQAEVIEILERLAGCWANGTKPSTQALDGNGKGAASALPPPPVNDGPGSSSYATSSSASGSASSSTITATPFIPDIPSSDFLSSGTGLYGSRDERAAQLDSARMLLTAVRARQNAEVPTSSPQLSIPLYGPRVEIALAWLGAVWIPELE